jgi:tetratricopeptide (TPR) repeat protein
MITVHNLGVARNNASDGLWALGRPREAAAKRVENRAEQEAVADRSAMVRGVLSGRLFDAAWMNAELGHLALADRQWTDSLKFFEGWRRSLGPDSFEGRVWTRAAAVFAVEQAAARGDLADARAGAKGAREGLLQVDPGDEPQHRTVRANFLRRLHLTLARVEIESNDWAAADRQLRWVAEARRELPSMTMESRRDNANELALQALVLARLGRVDEARPKAGQALAFQRELHAMATDDQMHKLDLALALVAGAWVDPARAGDLLAEAQAAFDSLPAAARALRTSRWIEGLIADARRGGR